MHRTRVAIATVALAAALAGCSTDLPRPAAGPDVTTAPYGTWASPLSAERIAGARVHHEDLLVDGADVYWLESRPAERGRNALVRRTPDGAIGDVLDAAYNVRTRVHQYGGGAFTVDRGTAYFSNFGDNRLYAQAPGGTATPLTQSSDLYYADCVVDAARRRLVCVREDHRAGEQNAVNSIVSVSLDRPGDGEILVSGADFYSTPRLSPDGQWLVWLSWNHPDMPWDAAELWLADLGKEGRVGTPQRVAGGQGVSVFQPAFAPDGRLYFVADTSGWWNLYRVEDDGSTRNVLPTDAEFGLPQWQFRESTYAFVDTRRVLVSYVRGGRAFLGLLDVASGGLQPLAGGFEPHGYVAATATHGYFMAISPLSPPGVMRVSFASGQADFLSAAFDDGPPAAAISRAQAISFPGSGGQTTHAFYYPPHNPDFRAPDAEKPPLIVVSHGGPTSSASSGLNLNYQYWTSRGFAVVDVDYGGSTGYGRAYRERLNGQWGIVDVEDCIAAAQYLVAQGKADPNRLAIRGGSAGGYTTLAALAFHAGVFGAGAVYFGVSDIETLAKDTHKFESRYLDRLIAPYPDGRDVYVARSPIHAIDRLRAPMIVFQGLDDKVVPPAQSELMVDAVRKQGLPVAYIAFEGEGHGFRQAANIARAQEAELYFYGRVFGFKPADTIEPVPIANLP